MTETPHAIVLGDFNRDTLRLVALAYRARRQAGDLDSPAHQTALAVYRERHPGVPEARAAVVVGQMIAAAINADPSWFWRGLSAGIKV